MPSVTTVPPTPRSRRPSNRWEDDGCPLGDVSFRYDGEAVCACMDGHADGLNVDELSNMRHWANDATSEDWGLGD